MKYADVKVGDVFAVMRGSFHIRLCKATVTKVTPTQFELDGREKCRKKDGKILGSFGTVEAWSESYEARLAEQVAEDLMRKRRQDVSTFFSNSRNLRDLTETEFQTVFEIFESARRRS